MAPSSSPIFGPNIVQPYRIHVSQKYLDLTRQKLEITRLPADPKWAPPDWDSGLLKSSYEPFFDHWLEGYDWRSQESIFNDHLPQFSAPVNGTRLHFVHKRSKAAGAIPLLFVHNWPESFISAMKIVNGLTEPSTPTLPGDVQLPSFHVVVPSLPGVAFSDRVPEAANHMHGTAELFDELMKGLGYSRYIAHGTGWGFKVCRSIALTHPESCIAIHTVDPEIPPPQPNSGYVPGNMAFAAFTPSNMISPHSPTVLGQSHNDALAFTAGGRPQTIAYALCDSPSGLLAYIMDSIRPSVPSSAPSSASSPASYRSASVVASPLSSGTPHPSAHSPQPLPPSAVAAHLDASEAPIWSPNAIINWTMLYWLPGPEAALRWLASSSALNPTLWTTHSTVPLGITQFYEPTASPAAVALSQTLPQWAEAYHRVAMVRRREGRVRFPAWESPIELIMDLREFAGLLGLDLNGAPSQIFVSRA